MTVAISLLGSTGSIGTQTLDVCRHLGIRVLALTAGRRLELLEQQVREFRPILVSVADPFDAQTLKTRLADLKPPVEIMHGQAGNIAAATLAAADTIVAAMVGVAGLEPVLAAARAGKTIALANKETLVAGGALVMPLLSQTGAKIYPVDSEHSAIWQCLAGAPDDSLARILITASGGPFRGRQKAELEQVTVAQALKHPTWTMGGKITIDSATLMNKGLEVIEASWLFDCPVDQIDVVVHPQSIIHSMVEFKDGSVLAQMGFPDMKLPIQLALTWPQRVPATQPHYNPFDPRTTTLTFEKPDSETFRLLALAYEATRIGGTLPAVLNTANEAAVDLFLKGQIGFLDIARRVEACLEHHQREGILHTFDFSDIMALDQWARRDVAAQ
ncbi:MAG: 1-deoxy-D-xylulose-5-phosphate reductoisomerase [Eubacteriales bacterium]|nr:1-deoxy-D-xylulose-5-phosphate reductoisomerase [Eubacteriales bacterium]